MWQEDAHARLTRRRFLKGAAAVVFALSSTPGIPGEAQEMSQSAEPIAGCSVHATEFLRAFDEWDMPKDIRSCSRPCTQPMTCASKDLSTIAVSWRPECRGLRQSDPCDPLKRQFQWSRM
jgi:anaerobic selenocysteine-containing dehydrogenase